MSAGFGESAPRLPSKPDLVPLRLEPPLPTPSVKPQLTRRDDTTRPTPLVLQFLGEVRTELQSDGESVSRIPRLEPVFDSQRLPVAVGVHTNVYKLRSSEEEDTPARPLPAVSLDSLLEPETRKLSGRDKVVTRDTLEDSGIDLKSFSSDDLDVDVDVVDFDDADMTLDGEREGRATAAIALPALSEEEGLDVVDDDFGGHDDLDELASQLGLSGLAVLRSHAPSGVVDDDLEEVAADDVELVAVPSKTDPFGAVVMGRLALGQSAPVPALDDDDGDAVNYADDDMTPPRGHRVSLIPQSLFDGADAMKADDLDGDLVNALDDDEETPPRGTPRPAITAPGAVRFVVAEAPARPRHDALSSADKARNKIRARDLYLVAMDDLGDGDPSGAIVHLELALAYDDETSLYGDLLSQLRKKKN